MASTLTFLVICAVLLVSPFVWRARKIRTRRAVNLAADTEAMFLEVDRIMRDHRSDQ